MMTSTPPSSTGHSPQDQLRNKKTSSYRVVRKRNRVPLSCEPCRVRKLKCNRSNPCENCVRRSDVKSCSYQATTATAAVSRARKQSAANATGSPDEMQNRIDRLEGLVLSLMNGSATSTTGGGGGGIGCGPTNDVTRHRSISTTGSVSIKAMSQDDDEGDGDEDNEMEDEVEDVRNALGVMKMHNGKSFYRGETHWTALLSEITEVKKFFEETKAKYENEMEKLKCDMMQPKIEATGFPFCSSRPPTRDDILRLVPRIEIVEMLVDAYFRNYDPIFHILHRPSFYRQYDEYRKDPAKTDVLWLGLLFIIMSNALRVYHFSGEEPPELEGKTMEMSCGFRAATEQCLIVGGYQKKPYMHTVQTLVILCASGGKDEADETWMFMGMAIRVAMAMGLHRDPNAFPTIPPGVAEMRRRVWTHLVCMDFLMSASMGLPSMIREEECDAAPPRNLHDDEIGDDTVSLPPERGKDVMTGVSYMLAKTTIAHIHSSIVRRVNVHTRPPYEEILKLEASIDKAYAAIPEFLRLRPIAESTNDPAWLIVQRLSIELLFQKSLIMLHRPFAASSKNARYLHSRARCVNAALRVLDVQREVSASVSATTLRPSRWFVESLGLHEFLHAAMIVCVHLSMAAARGGGAAVWATPAAAEDRRDKYRALEHFMEMSRINKDTSMESKKCFHVTFMMLRKLVAEDGYPFRDSLWACLAADPLPCSGGIKIESGSPAPPTLPPAPTQTQTQTLPTPPGPSNDPPPSLGLLPDPVQSPNSTFQSLFQYQDNVVSPRQLFSPPPPLIPFSPNAGGGGTTLEWDEWDQFMQGFSMDPNAVVGGGGSALYGWPGNEFDDPLPVKKEPVDVVGIDY